MKALLSIHDLMPETLNRVDVILQWLNTLKVPPATLLVVPGKAWQPRQLERLRELAAFGHPLAAHGWQHKTKPKRLYHRLHAALISRDVAEHLALDGDCILALMHRAHNWFTEQELPAPDLYVPPAWALGSIAAARLSESPYRCIETTRGLIFPKATSKAVHQSLPLTGYEADTALRAAFLSCWNAAQARRALRRDAPLRISIHPDDLQLRLIQQMENQIRQVTEFARYPKNPL
jgi:predicted deacetylase